MKKTHLVCLATAGLVLGGCSFGGEAGRMEPAYGPAQLANYNVQNAYGNVEGRLRDLSVAFRAAAPDTVTFDFNSVRLGPSARRALDQQAAWLLANDGVRMAVIGHADAVGSERYNDRLGLRRARVVLGYLVAKGVARDRLDALESRGENDLAVPTEGRERRNRRAVTAVSGFDRIFVGRGLDGEYALRTYDEFQGGVAEDAGDAGGDG